jgi:hypothetical protein
MKTLVRIIILVGVLLVHTPAQQALDVTAVAQQEDLEETPVPLHLVSGTHPDAGIQRKDWTNYSHLSLGKSLQFGDLIDPGGEPVFVLCADLTERVVSDLGPVPCPRERATLYQGEHAVAGWQRSSPEDLLTPFLITPRATLVMTTTPFISWNPLVGVDGYRVTVRGVDVTWTVDIDDAAINHLRYPEDAPPLVVGTPYTVEVTAITFGDEGRSSAEEDAPDISFMVAAPEKVEAVQATVADIQVSVNDVAMRDFAAAFYYMQNELNAEALQVLTGITGDPLNDGCPPDVADDTSPVIYLTLGDLYMRMQLERFATAAYICAHTQAVAIKDLESQALASTGLAHLALDEAMRASHVADARAAWEHLGAQAQVNQLEETFGNDQ